MNLEEVNIFPEKYTSETDKAVFLAGYLGFGLEYLIKCVQLKKEDITKQFINADGKDYNIWLQGNYMALTKLRLTVMNAALNSSTPALEKMLQYFLELDDEIKNIDYE